MNQDLTKNLHMLHTTELGTLRIRRNLELDVSDVVGWCRQQIEKADYIERKGKNWYISAAGAVLTVNAHSFTIITAHSRKGIGSEAAVEKKTK